MKHRTFVFAVIAIGVGIASFVAWGVIAPSAIAPSKESPDDVTASTIYYYGEECSHCKDIAKFLEENKIAEKFSFVKKEVWNDQKNSKEMQKKADECKIAQGSLGVPFVWSEGKCFVGGPDVEAFFKKKAGIEGN